MPLLPYLLLLLGIALVMNGAPLWGQAGKAGAAGPSPRSADEAPAENAFLPKGVVDHGWPFVRGPHFDGHSAEIHLADAWPAEGPPLLWRRELGQGYSAFVAVGDKVYTQAQELRGQLVLCLNADTGDTIWEYRYAWPYDPAGVYPGPRATPTLAEGRLFFAAPDGLIGCLDAESGGLLWSLNVVEKYHGRGIEFGYACSPTVVDGVVYLPVGGPGAAIVALASSDGSEIWKSGDDAASYTPILPIEHAGRKLLVGYLQNALVIVERETGRTVFRRPLSQGYDEHSAWPIYREPHLFTSAPFQAGGTLWELVLDAQGDQLLQKWSTPQMSNDVVSSVLVGDALFGFDLREAQAKTNRPSRGVFRCLDFATGALRWEVGTDARRTSSGDQGPRIGQAAVIVADGKLILLNDSGELILARASPDRYEELGRCQALPDEVVWTPPTLHRGRVYLRNHSQAACFYLGLTERLALPNGAAPLEGVSLAPRRSDWAAIILPVEPDHAFDPPPPAQFARWYAWSLLLLALGWGAGFALQGFAARTNRASSAVLPYLALIAAFFLGACGTAILSLWREELVFTWPLALYAVFHLAVRQIPLTMADGRAQRQGWLAAWTAVLVIVLAEVGYFLLCRRLELLFEWAFLAGAPFALAMIAGERMLAKTRSRAPANGHGEMLISGLAFTAFYWSSVGLLWVRYGLG